MTSNCMPHKECCHTGENITDTDFGYTLSLINGKYKLIIIYWLAQHKPVMGSQHKSDYVQDKAKEYDNDNQTC